MKSFACFVAAAACEIAGCYCVWMRFRLNRSAWWFLPGVASLILFALLLTRVETSLAGRAYAAYGGIYIVGSLCWMAVVEHARPALSDLTGAALCLLGAAVILLGPTVLNR